MIEIRVEGNIVSAVYLDNRTLCIKRDAVCFEDAATAQRCMEALIVSGDCDRENRVAVYNNGIRGKFQNNGTLTFTA